MTDERLQAKRYRVWLPIRIDGEGVETGFAVSQDVSTTGVLMAAADRLEVGGTLELLFETPEASDPTPKVAGRIVRVEENTADPHGLWPQRIAVVFDQPVPELESLLEEV